MEMESHSNHQLRAYLDKLDKSLGQISASDRADIIVEIKSHITEAKARHPEQSVSDIIESLGAPETVGNKYILERGLKPQKPPRSGPTIFKWIVIGFLGTCGMIFLGIVLLIWKFTPIISVDEKNQKISILGGLIKVDEGAGNFTITGSPALQTITSGNIVITGARTLAEGSQVTVPYKNGKMEVKTATNNVMAWNCALVGQSPTVDERPGELILDFTNSTDTKCELTIPIGSRLSMSGKNGKVELNEPEYNVDLKVANGKVLIRPKSGTKYNYDLRAKNGKVENFESQLPENYKISVDVVNGKIAHD